MLFLKKGEKLKLGSFEYVLRDDFVKDEVILDFNYKGSLKLKPTTRAHSREIKNSLVNMKFLYGFVALTV